MSIEQSSATSDAAAATQAAEDVPDWYHTLHLPDGDTPGLFVMDAVRDAVPWPDLQGKRCLDVATFDGYWAFEMERRGADEVVAIDIPSFAHVDWLPHRRHLATEQRTGAGFRRAAATLSSSVRRVERNVYDLHPDDLGTFDVVFLGALLLHLRSPFAALEAVRSVCGGTLVSAEQCDPVTSLLSRRPLLSIRGSLDWTWTVPNLAGHRRMFEVAGFDVHQRTRAMSPYGPGAPAKAVADASRTRRRIAQRLLGVSTDPGLFTSILVATPSPDVVADDLRRERVAQVGRAVAPEGAADGLAGVLASLPWPEEVDGDAVDLATPDGIVAFELERRGADRVVHVAAGDAAARDRLASAHDLLGSGVALVEPAEADRLPGAAGLVVLADPVDGPSQLDCDVVRSAHRLLSVQSGADLAAHVEVLGRSGWAVVSSRSLPRGLHPGPATALLAVRADTT